jgi:hypothetical protein
MASGPEHYREAERLLKFGENEPDGGSQQAATFAGAQVHATLALAAATALPAAQRYVGADDGDHEWWQATS